MRQQSGNTSEPHYWATWDAQLTLGTINCHASSLLMCWLSTHSPSCLWLVYSLTTYHITTLLHLMLFPLLLLCPVYCSCMSTSCQCYYSSAITISATTYHWHNHYKYLYILYEFYHFSFILQLAVPLLTMSAMLPITDLTVNEFGDVNIWIGQGRRYQNVPECC